MNERNAFCNNNKQQYLMENNRAYPCDTVIRANVNGNIEENGKVFKNKVFTQVKLKLIKQFN